MNDTQIIKITNNKTQIWIVSEALSDGMKTARSIPVASWGDAEALKRVATYAANLSFRI